MFRLGLFYFLYVSFASSSSQQYIFFCNTLIHTKESADHVPLRREPVNMAEMYIGGHDVSNELPLHLEGDAYDCAVQTLAAWGIPGICTISCR